MTITEAIKTIQDFDPEMVVFVRRSNGQITLDSPASIVEVTEEERELKVDQIAELKSPGFEYFMEVFMIQEMEEEMAKSWAPELMVQRIIDYAENDA